MLENFLEESARRHGERTSLVVGTRRLTYAALDEGANRFARALAASGVERGDRVGIFLDNVVETVVAIFGALKAGAAFVMVHPTTKGQRLAHKLRDSGAKALVLPAAKLATIAPLLPELPSLSALFAVGAVAPHAPPPGVAIAPFPEIADTLEGDLRPPAPPKHHIDADLAALLYTSGSTGDPKGVMLLHRNVTSAIRSIVSYLGVTQNDVVAIVLPLSFGYGLTQLFSAIAVGARVVLENGIAIPHVTLTKMIEERVTGLGIVPTIAAVLLGMDLSKYDLSALRFLTSSGDVLPVAHASALREALPEVALVCMYGLTECLRASYLEPDALERRAGSVGRGMPNQELYLVGVGVGEDGAPPRRGDVGELVVRGSHVMSGYWRAPEATAEKLRPGKLEGERVLYTGDLFREDDDGYLYFVGRKDDIVKTRGEKVSPREIEEVLVTMPGLAEAAVVGVPDPLVGHALKAVVVPRAGVELAPKDVIAHCARLLEDYMVPKVVEVRAELPKTETGKVRRAELR